jgi:hypothetical protein
MAGAQIRSVVAVAIVAIASFSVTACSKSNNSKTVTPNVTAPSQAAQGNAAAGSTGASAPAGGGAGAASAAAGGDTLLANGPACQIVTAADIQAAVGMPLGNITGDISGGPQGATNYHSCIWTKDASGTGAAVNIEYGTYASGSAQLAKQKSMDTDTASTLNGLSPNSETIKDVSIGDGGYQVTTSTGDDTIWFTKGQQVIQVEVIKEVPGATMTVAQKVASKL